MWVVILSAAAVPPLNAADDPITRPRIRKILIEPTDVFPPEEATNIFYDAANLFHWRTRRHIIRRELLFSEGEILDEAILEETERNLRALSYITSAKVWAVPVNDEEVDVYVRTRDTFTLRVELSGSYVGGSGKARAGLGEKNLFGLGKSLSASTAYRNSDEYIHSLKYRDPRVLGTRLEFDTEVSRSDEGEIEDASLRRPFFSLDTRWSYGIRGKNERSQADFYFGDIDDRTEVPQTIREAEGFVARRWGPAENKWGLGLKAGFVEKSYGTPSDGRVSTEGVPRHARTMYAVPRLGWDRIFEYQERRYLDTLTQVEDLAVGFSAGVTLGPLFRREESGGYRFRLVHGFDARAAITPWDHHVITLGAHVIGRSGRDGGQGLTTGGFYHHYWQGLSEPDTPVPQTLALSVAFDSVYESEDLKPEITLGEDSGLRGYEAKRFSGTKRLRINLEDRITTPVEILSFRLGLIIFADAAGAWDQGESMRLRDLKKSVGFGIRIGSSPILRKHVVRLDISFPLDKVDGKRQDILISASTGQVFSLFSNEEDRSGF